MILPQLKAINGDLHAPDHELSIKCVFPLAVLGLAHESPLEEHFSNQRSKQLLPMVKNHEEFDNCIIWIVDGLGTDASAVSWLKELMSRHGGWLSTVFPSTTVAAIASILTAVTPARHGLLGTKMYVPEIGMTVNLLTLIAAKARIKIPVYEAGIDPSGWLWRRPLHEQLPSDIDFYHLIMSHLVNSGYSRIIYPKNDKNIGYWLPHDGIERMRMILEDLDQHSAKKRLFIFYNNYIDSVSHHFTQKSPIRPILMDVIKDAWLKMLPRFSRSTLERTMILLVSDHGQIIPSEEKTISIDDATWERWLELSNHRVGSSGRTLDFHVPEEKLEMAINDFEEIIGDLGIVRTTDELLTALDADPPSLNRERLIQRFGTIHVILRDQATFSFSRDQKINTQSENPVTTMFNQFLSTHGSLTKNELMTPFFVTSLAEFLDILQAT